MNETIPTATVQRSALSRLPLVWLVPIVAALIGGWIAVRAVLEHGPTITVTFTDVDGIEATKTKVRYKSVDVGVVKTVTLSPDHHTVIVSIEMARFAQDFLVEGTRFWIVRPRLGASGVSGLGTLLSGAYIGMDIGKPGDSRTEFTGLETPPVIAGDTAGRQFILEAQDLGSLGVGAPAYFHHIEVGEISAIALNPDGHGIKLKLFVQAPYDRFVTSDTRFWHASGVDVALSADGVHMQTESLATVLAGGIAFEAPANSTEQTPATGDAVFHLAANRETAMKSPDRVVEPYILYFDETLRGLAPGAVVDFRGVEIGEVAAVNVEYDRANEKFLFPVVINVYPERIRSRYRQGSDQPEPNSHALVARMIEHGFRAQLRTGSLLTGQLYIALDFFKSAAPVLPQPRLTPMPLPTIPGDLEALQNTVVSVAHKLDQLPLEKIASDLDRALETLNKTLTATNQLVGNVDTRIVPEAATTLSQARMTLQQTQRTLAPEANLQNDLHTTLGSVSRAADAVRVLAEYLDQHPEALVRGKSGDQK